VRFTLAIGTKGLAIIKAQILQHGISIKPMTHAIAMDRIGSIGTTRATDRCALDCLHWFLDASISSQSTIVLETGVIFQLILQLLQGSQQAINLL
jgi:hypothetical protein